ncbi:response regulator transcription factor [Roseixanthobacter glucoisosaccharinicivorans]|uniref:response regulator transcription factor n=1 Tax=Roseixanthobacter glucoisosaccharinicivorans TaxID=3119923 RepID=UPI0037268FFB
MAVLMAGNNQDMRVMPGNVVLLVDDDPAIRNSLKFALELEGFDVRTFAAPGEILAADLPERGCIVVDYYLPGQDGLELLGQLKARDVALPAILITTNPADNVRRRASSAGVAIIEKPLLSNALSDAVRDSLARSS